MAEGTESKSSPQDKGGKRTFAAPTGTRDLYPLELARRRWIEDKWRKTAVRHGFEEIDGPTFEHTELYTAKSGDGIVGEIFSTFSGKDPQAVQQMGARLAAGDRGAIAPYALRPEFTPTLARMFAARGGQFPKPCKWFWQGPCYRAEKPQRGRLREFWQWNVDTLGDGSLQADVDTIAIMVDFLASLGLKPGEARVRMNDRRVLQSLLVKWGVKESEVPLAFQLFDRAPKMEKRAFEIEAAKLGLMDHRVFDAILSPVLRNAIEIKDGSTRSDIFDASEHSVFWQVGDALNQMGFESEWIALNLGIVRGLAYYTGMVFEVIVDGERAVAGGGRYDNLIETFGGPPTPAVGFGMGDVVLSLVLQDKGLMPSDKQIAADLGLRPDVFVISNGQPESDALVGTYLADLRRKGMHARRSYKTTRNVGKLLQDAAACNARYAVIIESATEITLKDMDGSTQDKGPAAELLALITPPAR